MGIGSFSSRPKRCLSCFRIGRVENLEKRNLLTLAACWGEACVDEYQLTSPYESTHEAVSTSGRLFSLQVDGEIGQIYELDIATGSTLGSFPAPESIGTPGYQGLALGPESLFFVDGSGSGPHTLYELNPTTGAVIDTDLVDDFGAPSISGLAYLDGVVYLGRSKAQNLLKWDPVADCVIGTVDIDFAIGGGLTGASEAGVLFNSNGSGDVVSIDPEDGRLLDHIQISSYSLSGGLAFVNGELLGGNYSNGKIYRIDPVTGAILGGFDSPGTGALSGLAGDGIVDDKGEIRGSIWNDLDGSGTWDEGEAGMEGWTVFLDEDENGVLDSGELSTVSGTDGSYALVDVPAGVHVLTEIVPSGWTPTFPDPTPSQGRLFALRVDDDSAVGTILELASSDGSVINEFAVPGVVADASEQGLAAGPDRLYYLDSGTSVLYELSLDTGAIIEARALALPYGESVSGLAYVDGLLYLVQHDGNRLVTWSPTEKAIVAVQALSVDLGGSLTGSGNQGLLYCGNIQGEIFAIEPTSGDVVRSLSTSLGQLQGGMAYLDGELVVCPFATSVTAYRLDPVSGDSLGSFSVGGSQHGYLTGLGGDGATGEQEVSTHIVVVEGGQVVEQINFGNQAVSGSQNVLGTSGDDVIMFTTSDTEHLVVVNGENHAFDPAFVTEIHIDGLEGNDQITIVGSDENEAVTIEPGTITVLSSSYAVDAIHVETILVDGEGGASDQITMCGGTNSNRFYSYADHALFTDSARSFRIHTEGFEALSITALTAGRDYAFLYDSPDADTLQASCDSLILRRGDGTATETALSGFERAYVYATQGGHDSAELVGSSTAANRFYGYADYSVLTESRRSYYLYVRGFEEVAAQSPSNGRTYAYLYDSPGVDCFQATLGAAEMDRDESWTDTTATGFARVYAYSTQGGNDSALLQGDPTGENQLRAYPQYSTLTDATRSFYHYARGFRWLTAEGSASDSSGDQAFLYDSSSDDIFYDDGQYAYLEDKAEASYQNRVRYFDLIYARSTDRDTDDTIDIDPEQELVYRLIQMGTW